MSEFEKSLILLILKKDLAIEEVKFKALSLDNLKHNNITCLTQAYLLRLQSEAAIKHLEFMIETLENPTENAKP